MSLVSGKGSRIQLGAKPLAAGGQGRVYAITAPSNLKTFCVKLFHQTQPLRQLEAKLRYMLANRPQQLAGKRYRICWPEDVVLDNGRFVGYLMPLAFPNSTELYSLCQPRVPSRLGQRWQAKFDRNSKQGCQTRLKVLINIAIPLHVIHSLKRYVVGDLKPQNILISVDGLVSVIDTDSIQINEGRVLMFPAPVRTPEYAPPEAYKNCPAGSLLAPSWDRFSFAIIVYELLLGLHPYTGTPVKRFAGKNTLAQRIQHGLSHLGPNAGSLDKWRKAHASFQHLPKDLKKLFHAAFGAGHGRHDQRPSAERWGAAAHRLIETKQSCRLAPPQAGKPSRLRPKNTPRLPRVTLQAAARQFQKRPVARPHAVKDSILRKIQAFPIRLLKLLLWLLIALSTSPVFFVATLVCGLFGISVVMPLHWILMIISLGHLTWLRGKIFACARKVLRLWGSTWRRVRF